MKFGLEQNIIDKLISVFEQNSKVDKAYIFGSRAKGNYRPDSDIDIAIKGQDITTDDIISMSVAFESKGINYKIDLINYHSIKEPDLKEHIDRVGIEFYSRWIKYKMGEIADVIGGGTPSTSNPENWNGTIPWLTPRDLTGYTNVYIERGERNITKEGLSNSSAKILSEGTVLLTSRAPIGYVVITKNEICTNQGFKNLILNKKIANNLFVYYWIKNNVEYLQSIGTGTTFAEISGSTVKDIDILLPPLFEQDEIASILNSLDRKIELLRQQNETLEKLAETLFRKWFIEEAIFTETLGDYVVTANTGLDAIKRAPIVEYETGIKCLRIQDVSQHKPIKKWGHSKVEENNFKKFQLKRDDIIMARTCSPGINYFVREDLPAVFNNGLVRIRAKKERVNPILLYYLFKTRDFIGHIDAISGGTSVQLNMQVGQLLSYEFSFPSIEKQNEIIESFIAFDNKTFENNNQIESLIELRDTLLPKLVSGEVRISELKAVAN